MIPLDSSARKDDEFAKASLIEEGDDRTADNDLFDSLATTCGVEAEALCAICGNGDSPEVM